MTANIAYAEATHVDSFNDSRRRRQFSAIPAIAAFLHLAFSFAT
jgi:hypothetical protein